MTKAGAEVEAKSEKHVQNGGRIVMKGNMWRSR